MRHSGNLRKRESNFDGVTNLLGIGDRHGEHMLHGSNMSALRLLSGRMQDRISACGCAPGIIALCVEPIEATMEAEQVNQIESSLSSLSVRAAELRRYL